MSKRSIVLASLLALPLFASGSDAWGRAGGGHSYSGSSSSRSSSSRSSSSRSSSSSRRSSSSSSRSSGGGTPVDLPLPCVVVLFLGVVGFIIVAPKHRTSTAAKATSRAIREGLEQRRAKNRPSPQQIAEGLQRIGARDPAFSAPEVLAEAKRLFVEMQHAWSLGRFETVRRAMSDGVLRRFTVQIALNRFWNKRNVTADVAVASAEIAGVESDDDFDTLHVRLAASARDCDVPAGTPDAEAFARAARAEKSSFVEYWSFVRRLNPESSAGKLSEGKCPSCGAPVPQQASVSCEYCKAILNSGTYGWVLSEITQEDEFELRAARSVEGFARLKAVDPAVNRQVLEDRATLVFWKWIEAKSTGEPRRFARLCLPSVLNELSITPGKPNRSFALAAVGSVDLAHVESDADYDRAWFELRWSTSGAGTGLARTSVLGLARRLGVKTHAKTGMSTDRCHSCAAVQTDSDAVECSHCGALLSQDWAFDELVSIDAWRSRRSKEQSSGDLTQAIGAIADPWERERALAVMAAMARADGIVTDWETQLLEESARRWGIDKARLEGLLSAPLDELTSLTPKSLDEARVLYRALVAAALVDGEIDPDERKLLFAMANHLKLPAGESQATLRELRATAGARRPG